jgi:hypothetical protein
LWLVARFDPTIRMTLNYIGRKGARFRTTDSARARPGVSATWRETVVDYGDGSMIETGVDGAEGKCRGGSAVEKKAGG